jgi:predicted CXXCH cytochrome family protein
VSCHNLSGWHASSHALSPSRTTGRTVDPTEALKYASVRDNGCMVCHKIHSAPRPEQLLRFRPEEDLCLNCHSGAVARLDISADMQKPSSHDGRRRTGVHDPAEDVFLMRRHVECVDCHNPHAVRHGLVRRPGGTSGIAVEGPNRYVPGVAISGVPTRNATYLYEICLKCHGDSIAQPQPEIIRQATQSNLRLAFQPNNPSFHPVAAPRRNEDVVSLVPPMEVGSVITCTDCHNSDDARAAGGTGPNGPHGSIYEPLLIRNYETADFTSESAQAYALCYQCHSRDSILTNESFPLHQRHIVTERTPCSVCHDSHGVFRGQGNSVNHGSLINFDLAVVLPARTSSGQRLEYADTGRFSGNCTLVCHGVTHLNFAYSQAGGPPGASGRRGLWSGGKR